jgi:hypothetical protein
MDIENENFGDLVASLVLKQYAALPLKGKPHGYEWTVLAGIVEIDSQGGFNFLIRSVIILG